MCVYIHMYMYILYMYREREIEIEREIYIHIYYKACTKEERWTLLVCLIRSARKEEE